MSFYNKLLMTTYIKMEYYLPSKIFSSRLKNI